MIRTACVECGQMGSHYLQAIALAMDTHHYEKDTDFKTLLCDLICELVTPSGQMWSGKCGSILGHFC